MFLEVFCRGFPRSYSGKAETSVSLKQEHIL